MIPENACGPRIASTQPRIAAVAQVQHILFPFDFSEPAILATRFVRAAASRTKASVTLLGVVPPVWNVAEPEVALVALDPEQMERRLQERLAGALTKELEGICVSRATACGDPGIQIVEFARTHAADLIMMPTHGFGLFRSLLIGSVTAKVLHDSECPVWTATHSEEQDAPEAPRNILCAVDSTEEAARIMRWAAGYAEAMGASLKLLHVVPVISDWLTATSERKLQEELREAAREKIQAIAKTAGLDLPLRVAVGSTSETVAEEARQEGSDLVIIGRGSLQSALGRLRTHAYGIIQRSPCPVISV